MLHDQSIEGRISCTTKRMIFDNRSFMTGHGGTTMNHWWYDVFATDAATYLRIAGEKFWTCSKTLLKPNLLVRSSTTCQTRRVVFLRFQHEYQNFGSYIGCNLVVSLVWLTPNMFKTLLYDFASTIVCDLCDQSCAVSVIYVRLSQFWFVHWL